MKFKRALQPSNVLWENMEFTKKQRRFRYACSIISMIVFGIFYFFLATYVVQLN